MMLIKAICYSSTDMYQWSKMMIEYITQLVKTRTVEERLSRTRMVIDVKTVEKLMNHIPQHI